MDRLLVLRADESILDQIYEEDFLGFSYGFRPGRRQHDALDALSYALLKKKVNYILDADIKGFFDNLDKSWMVKFMEHRVADPRILRLIREWLKAGMMEEGKWSEPQTGTPQGSVISPLFANVYLHYSFDLWCMGGYHVTFEFKAAVTPDDECNGGRLHSRTLFGIFRIIVLTKFLQPADNSSALPS